MTKHGYLTAPRRTYQVCQGVLNPYESFHSWIVAIECPSLADARVEFRRLEKLGPVAIIQIDSRVVATGDATRELAKEQP